MNEWISQSVNRCMEPLKQSCRGRLLRVGPFKKPWLQATFKTHSANVTVSQFRSFYSVSHPPDLTFFHFFHKRLRICNWFFTRLLNVPIFARLQIFIQLSPILTKLCHIKPDYPVHIICAKCLKRAKTCAFRRLRKSLIALLIVVCGKSL